MKRLGLFGALLALAGCVVSGSETSEEVDAGHDGGRPIIFNPAILCAIQGKHESRLPGTWCPPVCRGQTDRTKGVTCSPSSQTWEPIVDAGASDGG